MNTPLKLTKLSAVAQVAIRPAQQPDAEIDITKIDTIEQVRTVFVDLESLAESIKLNGIAQPLVVHEEPGGRFRLIVGERRLRAARLLGLAKVPVLIRRNLDALAIRRLQVTENNDREDLTPYEEAKGVMADVKAYGVPEASKIWNRSEGWISKRVAVGRYQPALVKLMEDGKCGDFEVLHTLNQIHDIDETEFDALCGRLADGQTVSREEARNSLARAKSWKEQQRALAEQRAQQEKQRQAEAEKAAKTAKSKAPAAAPAAQTKPAPKAAAGTPAPSAAAAGPATAPAVPAAAPATASADHAQEPASTDATNAAGEGDDLAEQRRRLDLSRKEIFEWGEANQGAFNSLRTKATSVTQDMTEAEWLLWQSFLTMTLPMLEGLGAQRAQMYLKALQGKLKDTPPIALWQELHPEKASGERDTTPAMPAGWRL